MALPELKDLLKPKACKADLLQKRPPTHNESYET